MIGLLTGTIFSNHTSPIIVTVGGVGYAVSITERLLNNTQQGETTTLYIHTHVREDALDLYGFETPEDLNIFKQLLTVSGIGPRTAMGILEHGAPSIRQAVIEGDVDFFTDIPRLGKKNAQKIIIELKNKFGSTKELDMHEKGETKELIEALMVMGFERKEIREAVQHIPDMTAAFEQKIREALRSLHKR